MTMVGGGYYELRWMSDNCSDSIANSSVNLDTE